MAEPANSLRGVPCQMPDLATRKPAIAVPPGACDAHFHLFGPPARYPYIDDPPYTPPPVGVDDYRRMIGVLGIERAVIVHTTVSRSYQGALDALAAAGGRWRAIALPDPAIGDRELERLHAAGFCGVRFNPYYNAEQELRVLDAVVARIRPLGWHLQFHLDARDLVTLAPRLERLPLEIVIDHLGHMPPGTDTAHPGFRILLDWLRAKRCWVKLSAPMRFGDPRPPYPSVIPVAQALVEAGPDRVVWGSDWPHVVFEGHMPNDGELIDLLALWAPDPALQRRILVDNPAALYRFPAPALTAS